RSGGQTAAGELGLDEAACAHEDTGPAGLQRAAREVERARRVDPHRGRAGPADRDVVEPHLVEPGARGAVETDRRVAGPVSSDRRAFDPHRGTRSCRRVHVNRRDLLPPRRVPEDREPSELGALRRREPDPARRATDDTEVVDHHATPGDHQRDSGQHAQPGLAPHRDVDLGRGVSADGREFDRREHAAGIEPDAAGLEVDDEGRGPRVERPQVGAAEGCELRDVTGRRMLGRVHRHSGGGTAADVTPEKSMKNWSSGTLKTPVRSLLVPVGSGTFVWWGFMTVTVDPVTSMNPYLAGRSAGGSAAMSNPAGAEELLTMPTDSTEYSWSG